MKTFIAYRFTGEDPKQLKPLLVAVRDGLKNTGVEAYCTFFDEDEFKGKSYNARQIMEHAFRIMNESDFLFALQTSENKSEGMLMEVGYCIAKGIPVVVAIKAGVKNTYVPEMGEVKLTWRTTEDLVKELQRIDFKQLKALPKF